MPRSYHRPVGQPTTLQVADAAEATHCITNATNLVRTLDYLVSGEQVDLAARLLGEIDALLERAEDYASLTHASYSVRPVRIAEMRTAIQAHWAFLLARGNVTYLRAAGSRPRGDQMAMDVTAPVRIA